MVEVRMPFYTVYVCQICGARSRNQQEMLRHEAESVTEKPDVKIGDEVEIYVSVWQQNRLTGRSALPEKFSVSDLYYATPTTGRIGGHHRTNLRVHQLCVKLSQATRVADGETRGLLAIGQKRCMNEGWRMSWTDMTWEAFLLWRKGDQAALESAELVSPSDQKTPLSLSERLWGVMGF